jgi:SPP1 gp7 family putative phage head morphogenesis protein
MATQAVNAILLDRTIDHAIDFQRYSNGVVRRMVAVLNRTDARLTAQLAEALMQLDRESFTVERLDALLSSVRALNAQAYAAVFEELRPELMALAEAEADAQVGALRSTLPGVVQARFPVAGVSIDQVFAAALSRPFQGRLLRDWAKTVEDGRLVLVRNAIRQGYMEGRTTAEIIAKLRGSRALNFKDGLLDRSRRELATVVQTALSHTAQTARQAFYDANTSVIKALKWTATLDTRTSPMCRARDGKLYDPETHKPLGHHIPWLGGPGRLHFNCRSVSSPVTKSWQELGIDAKDMPPGTRASMDGQVPEDMTYAQWFAKQSAARQDEIVGPVRGKLYRAGKLSFDAFTDDKGRWLTLPGSVSV